MVIYKLSQKVFVGVNQCEWFDFLSTTSESVAREHAKKTIEQNPDAILGIRRIEEIELKL